MDDGIAQRILDVYRLGPLHEPVRLLMGGFQHEHWRVKIEQGEFLLKKINPKVYHGYLQPDYLNYSEKTAEKFAKAGIPVGHSLKGKQGYVTELDGQMYTLSRWIPGKVIESEALTLDEITQIGALVGELHQAKISSRGRIEPPMWDEVLGGEQFREWQSIFQLAYRSIYVDPVMSHRDINLHNIIWHQGKPSLIDWENVGFIDRGLELLGVAVNCINLSDDDPDFNRIRALFSGYIQATGNLPWIEEPHVVACATSWLAWLGYLAELRHAEPTPIHQTRMKQEVVYSFKVLAFLLEYRDVISDIVEEMRSAYLEQ